MKKNLGKINFEKVTSFSGEMCLFPIIVSDM